jgi:CheY-like chemotaxis protein/HPt (histidine-containing phosphotransfer) domain-containing protein
MNLFQKPTGRFTTQKTPGETGFVFMLNKLVFEGDVLLCEDNRMNQDLISERLTKTGLKIIVAKNGKEGVEQAASRAQNGIKPFDLIFMDIHMPVMDGLEATAEIIKLNTGTPIIALTANNSPDERALYLARGMSDSMSKPFTSQELMACLAKYLQPRNDSPQTSGLAGKDDESRESQSEEKLRIKLVTHFLESNRAVYNEITKAIDEGDITLAHRLAHTLKGSAGILGKMSLRETAENVENLLENEEDRTTPLALSALRTDLDVVVAELESFMAELALYAGKGTGGVMFGYANSNDSEELFELLSEEEIRDLFETLEILFDGGDLECLNLIDIIRRIPASCGPKVSKSVVHEFIQQIEYFDFDKATKTLARLKKDWMGTGSG